MRLSSVLAFGLNIYSYLTVNIESEGFYPPDRLLLEAIKVMRTKISTIRNAVRALLDHSEDVEMAEG